MDKFAEWAEAHEIEMLCIGLAVVAGLCKRGRVESPVLSWHVIGNILRNMTTTWLKRPFPTAPAAVSDAPRIDLLDEARYQRTVSLIRRSSLRISSRRRQAAGW
ncbi:MAG: hypothetical protein OXG71_07720 [Rhodospirillales bacterium]|nr:hypothetical protein [Rhodospirillales bacterium]